MTTITLSITDEQAQEITDLLATRGNQTRQEVIDRCFERGLYAMTYRTEHNRKVYAEQKQDREELKALRAQLAKH